MPLILMTYGAAWFVLVSVKFSRVMGWLIKVSLLPSLACALCPAEDNGERWKVFPLLLFFCQLLGTRSA